MASVLTSPMTAKNIGIVGGGLMGMTLAHKLAADGHRVTVIENADRTGGLTTWHDFDGVIWDRFYHVILPSDQNLIGLLDELDMKDDLQWRRTYTGFYVDKKLHSISSNVEFLKFPLLSLVSKVRLGFTMLYASRINNWKPLEKVSCEQWLRKVSGNENVEKLWKPLLLAKLGPSYQRVSAVFIWSYIKRMFSARDKSASAEHLGHVKGGYHSIMKKMECVITGNGGTVVTQNAVKEITPSVDGICVKNDSSEMLFDHVICTSPVNVLKQIVSPGMLAIEDASSEPGVEYLGVVCVVLVTKKPITRYYVVNIADESIPFTGVIGMSNVVDVENTDGYNLTYLPRYLLSTDEEISKTDEYFKESFVDGIKRMFPDFDETDIVSVHVNRAIKVQPLQVLGYSSLVPGVQTTDPRLHVLNTSQFVNATLNNNEVVGAVNRFYSSFTEQVNANA